MVSINIKSIRYGHANNSSSSHSIVFLGDKKVDDEWNGDGFGWNFFTLASKERKSLYLLSLLYESLIYNIEYSPKKVLTEKTLLPMNIYSTSEEEKNKIQLFQFNYAKQVIFRNFSDIFDCDTIKEFLGTACNENTNWRDTYYVDHQSFISLPKDKKGKTSIEFARRLFSVLLNDNFAILGGNDNSDHEHKLKKHHIETKLSDSIIIALSFLTETYGQTMSVYDKVNDDWILQKSEGDKLRISFNENPKTTTKSGFPELVDLKITNQCKNGCEFCYQSSKSDGKHADFEHIKKIVDILDNSDVVEIALGGGEPTLHPNFIEILKYIRSKNIKVGFSTKNYKIFDEGVFINEIKKCTNSIAISITDINDFDKINYEREKPSDPIVYFQIILEMFNNKQFISILRKCDEKFEYNLTLLGFKRFGKGKNDKFKDLKAPIDWIDDIKKYKGFSTNVGIDSIIVKQWKDELIKSGCEKLMLIGEEGKFSCYIDAVNLKIAPSSFTNENIIDLNLNKENILEEFAKF